MLQGLTVLEMGDRTGVRACGALFAQLGARVVSLATPTSFVTPIQRAQLMRGKEARHWDGNATNVAELRLLLVDCHIVLTSQDMPLADADALQCVLSEFAHLHIVDIVAARASGSDAGEFVGLSDLALQALSGMMETTGMPDGPPVAVDGQPLELIAGLHAFAAALACVYASGRAGQRANVNLMDCAISSHAVFVSKLTEQPDALAKRSGNRHQLASPWNIFAVADGWLLICMASEIQWQRVCGLMGTPDLATEAGFDSGAARQQNIDAVEAKVQEWVGSMTGDQVSAVLLDAGIPCGAVAPVDQYPREPNLAHRGLLTSSMTDGLNVFGVDGLFKNESDTRPIDAERDDATADDTVADPAQPSCNAAPLTGVRVVEIGQFTTAPLAGRYLAQLGAEVIKVESPAGEAMRAWMPQRHGVGTFFVVNNTGKRSVALDLKSSADMAKLRALVASADVLIENLKPGALAKMGLSVELAHELKPDLVYCAVSGFGHDSIYPGRPAYDTVIQAMSGLMQQTRAEGVPVKTGMSAADVMGANVAVGAIIAALVARRRAELAQFIDISMQDVAAWSTQLTWNDEPSVYERSAVVECRDGYVLVEDLSSVEMVRAQADTSTEAQPTQAQLSAEFAGKVHPIRTLNQVLELEIGATNVLELCDAKGRSWPVLRNPIEFLKTPICYAPMLGDLGDDDELLRDLTTR
jgi:crotonobetainyl-CoA:carnitine CoA-transferase CaiB-like acyl-CoA transferase